MLTTDSPVIAQIAGDATRLTDITTPTSTRYPTGVITTLCKRRNPRLRQPTASVSAAATICGRPRGRMNGAGASMVTPTSRASDRYSLFHWRPVITTSASSGMPISVTSSTPDAKPVANR